MKRYAGVLVVMMLFGCGSAKVVSFVNEGINFADYSTYYIIRPPFGEEDYSEEAESRVRQFEEFIGSEMKLKGYKPTEYADLKVKYAFMSNAKSDVRIDNANPFGYQRYGYYNPNYRDPMRVRTSNYQEAILLIEIHDSNTNKLLWQGSMDLKYAGRNSDPGNSLPLAIKEIFKTYPYEAGKARPVTQAK